MFSILCAIIGAFILLIIAINILPIILEMLLFWTVVLFAGYCIFSFINLFF